MAALPVDDPLGATPAGEPDPWVIPPNDVPDEAQAEALPPVPPDEALPPLEEPPEQGTGDGGQTEGAALPQEPPLP